MDIMTQKVIMFAMVIALVKRQKSALGEMCETVFRGLLLNFAPLMIFTSIRRLNI